MNQLVQFHIDHNYYIKIRPLPKINGCIAIFPHNLFIPKPIIKRTYIINENPICVDVYNTEHNKTTSKKIDTEKFGIRLLVLEDVLLRTIGMGMSTKLIIVENTEKGDIFSLLKLDMTTEELELERDLCIEFRKLLTGKEKCEVKDRLSDCYERVLECFENGGL